MRRASDIITALLLTGLLGCDTISDRIGQPNANSTPVELATENANVLVGISDDSNDADDCPRYVIRIDGSRICINELIAILYGDQPHDNDGDGIPNLADEDIDGDGVPNAYDVDVDGDGIPNSEDDDVDDDGVLNEFDVDIDGDFLRNRWDPDMDGDLLYNGQDPDADGDGKFKFPSVTFPQCGPVDLFNDPQRCMGICPPSMEQNNSSDTSNASGGGGSGSSGSASARADSAANDTKEDKCKDKGKMKVNGNPAETGRNLLMPEMPDISGQDSISNPEEPNDAERNRLDRELESLLGSDEVTIEELRNLDPEANEIETLDVITEIIDRVIETDLPNDSGGLIPGLTEEGIDEFDGRRISIGRLTDLNDVNLSEAADVIRRFDAAVFGLEAALRNLVDTTLEVDANFPDTDILDDGSLAVLFMETATDAEIPATDVAPSVGPAARTIQMLGDVDAAPFVWQIVVDQVSNYRNDDDSQKFSLPRVTVATERLTGLLEMPSIGLVSESLATVLKATADRDLDDPLAVVDRLEQIAATDPGFSISDGISEDEANLAADDVLADMP